MVEQFVQDVEIPSSPLHVNKMFVSQFVDVFPGRNLLKERSLRSPGSLDGWRTLMVNQ